MSGVTSLSEARKQRKGERASVEAWAREIDDAIERLNGEFALVALGDRVRIMREYRDNKGRPCLSFYPAAEFRLLVDNERYPVGEDREAGIGELWLRHPDRRTYDGVVFEPWGWRDGAVEKPDLAPGWYNLWKGYTVEPAPFYEDARDHVRHFSTLYEHIYRNIAGGDPALARYVWGWYAHLLQRPAERPGVGLVMRGKQGSGKSSAGDIIGSLLGEHYVLIDNPNHLVGQFNGHMFQCLFLQADEGFWAGDKVSEGRLKSLLTSGVHMVEKKGIDAIQLPNYIRLQVTSNNAWVVPAGLEERRWAVIDVGDGNLQDHRFFERMYREIAEGGAAHLLAYLLRFNLATVNLNDLPKTAALYEQKVASMTEIQSWWLDILHSGELLKGDGEWTEKVATDPLYQSYCAYATQLGKQRRQSKEVFGMEIGKLMPPGFKNGQKVSVPKVIVDPTSGTKVHARDAGGGLIYQRVRGYHIPPLMACRRHFAELVRHNVDWGEGGDDDYDNGGCSDMPEPDDLGSLG